MAQSHGLFFCGPAGSSGENIGFHLALGYNIAVKGAMQMKIIRQYSLFLIGLFIASMGVAFSTKAGLGTSPVASLPYSVSLVSSLLSYS